MKTLYPFQQQVIDELRQGYRQGHLRQLLALATGGGKTVVASHLIRNAAEKGRQSLFIVDRIELVNQAVKHLRDIGLRVGVLQGDNTDIQPGDEVIVASIQSLRSRGAPTAGFVIVDEAHILHQAHIDLMNRWNALPFIGLSATPLREDLGKYFTNLVRGPSVRWLTDNGFLTPATAFCPSAEMLDRALSDVSVQRGDYAEKELSKALNQKELIGDIVSTWQAKAEGRPTLVFAVDIAHSKAIADDFFDAGATAAHLDAYTPPEQRQETIQAFRAGDIRVLSSVNVLGIGFDVPQASCAVLARPTLSEALHMQQMGRVIRTAEGKNDALILDHVGNTVRFGLPVHFTVPDLSTEKRQTAKKKKAEPRMKTCSECGSVMEPGQQTCPACGIDQPTKSAEVVYLDGDLVQYGDDTTDGKRRYSLAERKRWYQSFLWICDHRGWSRGAAHYWHVDKFGANTEWDWRNLPPLVPDDEITRYVKYQMIRRAKAQKQRLSA